MGAPYDIYPAVDSSYNFPPVIRQALVQSTDVQAALASERDITNQKFNAERQITNDKFVFERTVTTQQLGTERIQTNTDRSTALADYDTRAVVAARGRTKKYTDLVSMHSDVSNLNDGDLAVVGRFQYSNGILHRSSVWQKSNGILNLVGDTIYLEAADRAGTLQAAQSVINNFQTFSSASVFYGVKFKNVITPHVFTWDGTRLVPRTGFLIKKRWQQWAYGPATRAGWWDPPFDTWNDDYGVAWGNAFLAPANGFYRITGNFGYQQSVENERVIARLYSNDGQERWSGLPRYMWGDTPYPFTFTFYSNYNVGWNFSAYHSGQTDFYMIRGEVNASSASEFIIDFLGSNA